MSDDTNVKGGGARIGHGDSFLRSPNAEIDPGYYILYQGNNRVGRAFVPREGGEEYWELFANYRYPSRLNPNVTLRFEYSTYNVPRNGTEFIATCTNGSTGIHLRSASWQ
jgi:hypothetical protein